jgi:hypothetical protein
LIPKQIYEEQLKLKKRDYWKGKLVYPGALFSNKILFGFDDNAILWLGSDLLIL